jgi:hypothetical protein
METNTAKAAAKKGVHHVGADIPLPLFAALKARAVQDGVPYSIIIRWALQDFLLSPDPVTQANAADHN